jgi:predicted ArsR family transcriptional regulator
MKPANSNYSESVINHGANRIHYNQMLRSLVMEELGSRASLLRVIQERGELLSIQQLCDVSGLHANTVRTHLDSLLAAGEIEREQAPASGRGRPLWLYRTAVKKVSPYEMLAEILASQLSHADDPTLTERAAKKWANAAETEGAVAAKDGDEAVEQVARSLRNVGFAVSSNLMRDEISITECPYAALVEQHPKICDVHAALVSELMSRSGQPITIERLDVWAKPGVCVAHINRSDRSPARTITPGEIAAITVERTHDDKQ